MKRLGGIITVLLVVFSTGTVISCASTKSAVVKEAKRGKNNFDAVLTAQENHMNGSVDVSTEAADISVETISDLSVPAELNLTAAEEMKTEVVLGMESSAAQLVNLPVADNQITTDNMAAAMNVPQSLGSVLFTLQRAEELKGASPKVEEDAVTERPVLSVLQERIAGYQKEKNGQSIPGNFENTQAVIAADYKNLPVVLPAAVMELTKAEVMIQENAYLAHVISLPKIAENTMSSEIMIDTAATENSVMQTPIISSGNKDASIDNIPEAGPQPLEIVLGNSVTPFGLPGSFLSPLANPEAVALPKEKVVQNNNITDMESTEQPILSSVKENNLEKNGVSEIPVMNAQSILEMEAAAKEDNRVATEENNIYVVDRNLENLSDLVYIEREAPEELEEAIDFEMKPIFILQGKEVPARENNEITISQDGAGWRISQMNRASMDLLERKISPDGKKTEFRLKTGLAGTEQVELVRYNEEENRQEMQVLSVSIKPELLIADKNKKNAPKAKKEKKSKAVDDYRRTLADHLYADENYAQAAVYYKKLIEENMVDSELFYKAAHAVKETGDAKTATEYYLKNLAEEGNPFYEDAVVEYIQLLKDGQEFERAITQVYELGLSKGLGEVCTQKLYRVLGDLFFNMKNYTEAARTYKTVLNLYPFEQGEDKAMFYLAYALELQQNPEFHEAKRVYRELLTEYPESKYVNLSRSRIGFIDRHYIKVN